MLGACPKLTSASAAPARMLCLVSSVLPRRARGRACLRPPGTHVLKVAASGDSYVPFCALYAPGCDRGTGCFNYQFEGARALRRTRRTCGRQTGPPSGCGSVGPVSDRERFIPIQVSIYTEAIQLYELRAVHWVLWVLLSFMPFSLCTAAG
ncbi:hypothetical protein OBBRIDRAFT_91534 [Obba rivulosa]|uniref:Uncharacterized protein n=1 Tax=Obba rivulosa TaxID=1052685 RepID=A0A8E2AP55_9APHY|nr:hypothetical protein OBBRIDRAFT_91534 [Obba rivulosa]